ncbi:MAG: aromatic amino acid DMT transporter YddG [Arachnia sp.]
MSSVPRRRATAFGLIAIVLWSALVGLIRLVSDSFGPTLGLALIYTLATAILWVTRRPRDIRTMPRRYLVVGGILFVSYEIAFGLAIGLARDAEQALEVSIVNYLWPTLMVLLLPLLERGLRPRWYIVPAVLLATLGIAWVVGGDAGLDPARMAANVASNPLPYALALGGALGWAVYSTITPGMSGGRDAITVFFTAVTVALWVMHLVAGRPVPGSLSVIDVVPLLGAAAMSGAGYAFWNVGILHGNRTLIASASYATPVLSSAIGTVLLGAALTTSFWQGVALVTAGSLLGWRATRAG